MEEYQLIKGSEQMRIKDVQALLKQTYWAAERTEDIIQISVNHSLCFGLIDTKTDRQIGFARAITDCVLTYYLCDVIIDEAYRGKGLGTRLLKAVCEDEILAPQRGILVTRDAQAFYAKFGYIEGGSVFMQKRRPDKPRKEGE